MLSSALLIAGLSALAAASPVNMARQFAPSGTVPPFPYAAASGYAAPSGAARPSGVTFPTATSVPYPAGDATCNVNGSLVCNGSTQFGICNWGQVVWQDVAAGTACQNGELVYAPAYGTAVQASGVATPTGY